MISTLEGIIQAGLCHGCGGCASALPAGRVKMRMTHTGYLRPEALNPLSKIEQLTVVEVCSGHSIGHQNDIASDPIWGPVEAVRTGHAADASVRYAGSSGGVISAILIHLLGTNVIDSAWHTVADPADPFGNKVQDSKTRVDVLAGSGSRYAPSSPLEELDHRLESVGRFAFVGKPCDVATLRRMALRDPRIAEKIPVMISFMCAGLPSRSAVLKVPQAMGADTKDVAAFAFRGQGWPGYARTLLHDGRKLQMSYSESWGKILSRELQFRCKICPDGTGEFADIVCADAWFGQGGYPDFNERPGRSLILTRTPLGEQLLRTALDCGAVVAEPSSKDEIELMQPYQYDRKRSIVVRLAALIMLGLKRPCYRRMGLWRAMLHGSPLFLARNCIGTMRRILTGSMRRS